MDTGGEPEATGSRSHWRRHTCACLSERRRSAAPRDSSDLQSRPCSGDRDPVCERRWS